MHVLRMLWVGINELVVNLAWYMFDDWLCIWNDMLLVCMGNLWFVGKAWIRFG